MDEKEKVGTAIVERERELPLDQCGHKDVFFSEDTNNFLERLEEKNRLQTLITDKSGFTHEHLHFLADDKNSLVLMDSDYGNWLNLTCYVPAIQLNLCSQKELDLLSHMMGNKIIVSAVARSKRTSSSTLDKLATKASEDISDNVALLKDIASNAVTSSETLEKIAVKANRLTKWQAVALFEVICENPNTPSHILKELARDNWSKDRLLYAVAKNPSTDNYTLVELSCHPSLGVRVAVPNNPTVTVEILDELTKDKEGAVRFAVARSKYATRDLLEKLLTDQDEMVREAARWTIEKRSGDL